MYVNTVQHHDPYVCTSMFPSVCICIHAFICMSMNSRTVCTYHMYATGQVYMSYIRSLCGATSHRFFHSTRRYVKFQVEVSKRCGSVQELPRVQRFQKNKGSSYGILFQGSFLLYFFAVIKLYGFFVHQHFPIVQGRNSHPFATEI